ncbi:MAG: hypothetical protein AMXMBFR66_07410 [Pseudomonadota bacterium]|nr:hypothetical protein [Rubrivivax sp.]NLZ42918.1 hypothetical protein [Comamonadaceae bacterium]
MFDWLLQRLAPARAEPRAFNAPFSATLPPLDALDDAAAEPILGCGWFDSSHDLRQGLVVQEHASADMVSEALGVAAWLELHLREWRGAVAA